MAEELHIDVGDVQVNSDQDVLPSGCKVVASYNWSTKSESGNRRIITPGGPRLFVSPSGRGFTLGKDTGHASIDENKSRMDSFSALEPLFLSLNDCAPDFNMETVDVVTDRNNLRKLLKFCGSPGERTSSALPSTFRHEPFKIFVHAIGEDRTNGPTLAFTRVTTGKETHYPGYGFNFEKKLTKDNPSAPSDAGGFRVLTKMSLDGVSLLVRSEVDAGEIGPARSSTRGERASNDELIAKITSLVVSSGEKNESTVAKSTSSRKAAPVAGDKGVSASSGLTSATSGCLLDDDAQIVEMKTKNGRHADTINWKDFYWQMALGGAHKLVLGLHNRGTFDDVQELPIDKVKDRADETGSSSMVYLANTLREVIKAAHCLMASPASPYSGKTEKGARAAVVVEHSPTMYGEKVPLRVRLAVPEDGAIAP